MIRIYSMKNYCYYFIFIYFSLIHYNLTTVSSPSIPLSTDPLPQTTPPSFPFGKEQAFQGYQLNTAWQVIIILSINLPIKDGCGISVGIKGSHE